MDKVSFDYSCPQGYVHYKYVHICISDVQGRLKLNWSPWAYKNLGPFWKVKKTNYMY